MIAAARRRLRSAPGRLGKRLRGLPAAGLGATRALDRRANRLLVRTWPPLERRWRRGRAVAGRGAQWAKRRLRPIGVRLFRVLAWLERRLLRARALAIRAATRASAVLTPERAIAVTIVAAAACLGVAQFVDYRAVEIGQPGYAGLVAAEPPTVAHERAGEAHAYLLLPVALLAAALAAVVIRNGRRRGLGRVVFVLGALSLAVVLLVDMPAGLDESAQASSFSGATAVLGDGFYAQLAAAGGLMLGGLLLAMAPRARRKRSERTRQGRRSAPARFLRKQRGRPKTRPDEGLQRPGATMRGRA